MYVRYLYSNLEGDDNYEHLEWKCINEKRRHVGSRRVWLDRKI
jgi:hypothetical protein